MLDNDVLWYWLTAALVLGVLECFVDGFIALGLAAACLVFGVLSTVPVLYQSLAAAHFVGLAAGITVAFFLLGTRFFWRGQRLGVVSQLGARVRSRLIGQIVVVSEPIINGQGRVTATGTVWKCLGCDATAGTRVLVTDQQGNTLLVKPLETQ